MKVLIVGGGGREHALAWKLRQDDPSIELIAAPGNPGIASLARCVPVKPMDVDGLVALAEAERVDFALIGPEGPLEAGIVDAFRARGLAAFGPTRAAARIETSKRVAKELMRRAGVPTAHATSHRDVESARRAARELGAPVVIKASGLAAGKGVVVCETLEEADVAIEAMLGRAIFGAAGAEVLVEEFMTGEELSVFAITDGERVLTMLPAQDHKRRDEGDRGPNTGGMGAYAPASVGDAETLRRIEQEVLLPTLAAMRESGAPFTGLLYAGLMLTESGPRVVEFNCRFGDPETQAILPLMASSLLEPALAVARGESLAGAEPLAWRSALALTTVIAARGYPDAPVVGTPIVIPPSNDDEIVVFHAGTARDAAGRLVSAGGRVLAVTAVAASLEEARRKSVAFAERVELEGRHFRRDIGWRELRRHARAT